MQVVCKLLASVAAASLLGACANSGAGKDLLTRSIGTRISGAKTADASAVLPKDVLYWEKEVRKNPKNAKAALNLGQSLKAAGAKRRAYAFLRAAAAQHPEDVGITSEYGRLAVELDQLSEGDTVLARIDTANSQDWRVISARGTIRAKQGKHVEARAFYERALKIAPNEASVLNNIALTYALDGKPERAESLLRRAAENRRSSERVTENLALVLGLQGRFDEARQISNKSLPTEVANANLDFLRRMVGAADSSESLTAISAPAQKQRVAMADSAPGGLVTQKREISAKSVIVSGHAEIKKKVATKGTTKLVAKADPTADKTNEKRKVRKTIFGEFKYPARDSGGKAAPKKSSSNSKSVVQQARQAKPAIVQEAAKSLKPPSLPQWSIEVNVGNKSAEPPSKPATQRTSERPGTNESEPIHVSHSPMPPTPAPDKRKDQTSFDWTSKVTFTKDGSAIKRP